MNLFTELKRRNVFRFALFYIVAAQRVVSRLMIELVDTMYPRIDCSDRVIR